MVSLCSHEPTLSEGTRIGSWERTKMAEQVYDTWWFEALSRLDTLGGTSIWTKI